MRFTGARLWPVRRLGRARLPVITALASAGGMLLAAGCTAAGGTTTAGGGASVTVAAIPGIDTAPLYLAQRDGLFTKAGLKVTVDTFSTSAAEVRALTAGRVSVAAGDYGTFFYAQATASKPSLRIIADGYDASSGVSEVLALPRSGISSPTQLAGKTIGIAKTSVLPKISQGTPFSLATMALDSVLTNDFVSYGSLHWKELPAGGLLRALKKGKVQAIVAPEPYIFQAEKLLGAIDVQDVYSGATAGLPLTGYFTTSTWAGQHQAAVGAFRSALEQAQADAAMASPVRFALPGWAHISPQDAMLVTLGTYPTTTNAIALQRVAQLMFTSSVIRKPVNVNAMLIH